MLIAAMPQGARIAIEYRRQCSSLTLSRIVIYQVSMIDYLPIVGKRHAGSL